MADDIRERLARVNERIEAAAARAGRSRADVTLVAVSKTVEAAAIQEAVEAGVCNLGENRVQEAAQKAPLVRARAGVGLHWHLIGHLQSNKARAALAVFDLIHTVDSVELVSRLDRIAEEIGKLPGILIQVKISEETTKSGAAEDELAGIVESLDQSRNLRFKGLMAIPPVLESAEEVRPYFRKLRLIMEGLNRNRPAERRLAELSMGMSNDFEIAIEEGATIVRVGTAIFGPRLQK